MDLGSESSADASGMGEIAVPPSRAERFNLRDLMAIVAAFGLGLGLGMMVPFPPREGKLFFGVLLGLIFTPPVVLVVRRQWRPGTRPVRAGEWMGLIPTLGLLYLYITATATSGSLSGLLLWALWGFGNLAFGTGVLAVQFTNLVGKARIKLSWLEIYGFLLHMILTVLFVSLLVLMARLNLH